MDRRRGARISSQLWVKFAGVDDGLVLRHGNISMSGLYVELEQSVGEPGSMQSLSIASHAKDVAIDVLARVVRVVSVHDLWHGPTIAGVALELLPENVSKRRAMEQLLRTVVAAKAHVVRRDKGEELTVSAVGPEMGVRVMVLETTWPVPVGEQINCQLDTISTAQQATLQGQVARTTREDDPSGAVRYRVEVDFLHPPDVQVAAAGRSIVDAMDSLLEDVVFPDEETSLQRSREHLKGLLARIQLPSLLAFFELERLSGVLWLQQEDRGGRVYLRGGQVVDAEIDGQTLDAQSALFQLCAWETGEFEFQLEAVERPDRLGQTTSALLLELARQWDEVS